MKTRITIAACLLTSFTVCGQQTVPLYKTSLDSLKTIIDPLRQETIVLRLEKANPGDNFEQYKLMLANNFAAAKNTKNAVIYFKQLQGRARTMALNTIPLAILSYDATVAELLVEDELANARNSPQDRQVLLNAQSYVLAKKGDYARSFAIYKEYYGQLEKKSAAVTANYYYLMSKSGRQGEAFPELEKAVLEGTATTEMKNELERAYVRMNPAKDSKAFLSGLINQFEEKLRAELSAKMVKEPAPNFQVKDINGKTVSLSDFKGKTIVLDFWATWCGPCKRALPAMQMTVDKYKTDANVKFLFIHTWESVADPKEEAEKYFAEQEYRLPLYMDMADPITHKNPAVSLFNVEGIPAKFVIDGDGNIRFKTSGFGGTNEAAVNELSAMIELSRNPGKV